MKSSVVIAGIDEAGRGCLAGPVSAAACIVTSSFVRRNEGWSPKNAPAILITDSKKLTTEQRDVAFAWISAHCIVSNAFVDASFIDSDGILAATERAMQEAVALLAATQRPTYLLVDGRDRFWFDYPHSSIIHGDALEPAIAAASIIAKVTRDRMLCDLDRDFPQYGFAVHKGYGTPKHLQALEKHGPCAIHRRSFLKKLTAGATSP